MYIYIYILEFRARQRRARQCLAVPSTHKGIQKANRMNKLSGRHEAGIAALICLKLGPAQGGPTKILKYNQCARNFGNLSDCATFSGARALEGTPWDTQKRTQTFQESIVSAQGSHGLPQGALPGTPVSLFGEVNLSTVKAKITFFARDMFCQPQRTTSKTHYFCFRF